MLALVGVTVMSRAPLRESLPLLSVLARSAARSASPRQRSSCGAYLLYLFVLGRWPASRAAYSFVLILVVTVLLSAWLDDEPVGPVLVLGGVLVLAGVYVGALRQPPTQGYSSKT